MEGDGVSPSSARSAVNAQTDQLPQSPQIPISYDLRGSSDMIDSEEYEEAEGEAMAKLGQECEEEQVRKELLNQPQRPTNPMESLQQVIGNPNQSFGSPESNRREE